MGWENKQRNRMICIASIIFALFPAINIVGGELMLPYSSVEGTTSFCKESFGTNTLYNIHIALHSDGNAYFQVAKYPVLSKEFPIKIQCDNQAEFVFTDWSNYTHNRIHQYRGFIGRFPTNVEKISCCVAINGIKRTLHAKRPTQPKIFLGKPENVEFEIVPLSFDDTMDGRYKWTDVELLHDADCQFKADTFKTCPPLSDKLKKEVTSMLGKSKVHVTLTTSPKRLLKLHYVLQTLDMTRIDKIFISLPRKYKNREQYEIPRKLVKLFPKIQFLSASVDIGPALKVAGAAAYLQKKGRSKDVLVVIDDDNVYGPSLADSFAYFCKKYPRSIFASSILDFINFYGLPPVHSETDEFLRRINVIEGFCGYSSLAGNFDVEMIVALTRRDQNPVLSPIFLSDDLAISFVAAFNGLIFNTTYVSWEKKTPFYDRRFRDDLNYFRDEDALHLYNADNTREHALCNTIKYAQCMQIILKYALDYTKPGFPYFNREEFLKRLKIPFKDLK